MSTSSIGLGESYSIRWAALVHAGSPRRQPHMSGSGRSTCALFTLRQAFLLLLLTVLFFGARHCVIVRVPGKGVAASGFRGIPTFNSLSSVVLSGSSSTTKSLSELSPDEISTTKLSEPVFSISMVASPPDCRFAIHARDSVRRVPGTAPLRNVNRSVCPCRRLRLGFGRRDCVRQPQLRCALHSSRTWQSSVVRFAGTDAPAKLNSARSGPQWRPQRATQTFRNFIFLHAVVIAALSVQRFLQRLLSVNQCSGNNKPSFKHFCEKHWRAPREPLFRPRIAETHRDSVTDRLAAALAGAACSRRFAVDGQARATWTADSLGAGVAPAIPVIDRLRAGRALRQARPAAGTEARSRGVGKPLQRSAFAGPCVGGALASRWPRSDHRAGAPVRLPASRLMRCDAPAISG